MLVNATKKHLFPFTPHIIWIRKQINIGPRQLIEITLKFFFVKVFKMSRFNHARAVTIVLSLTRQENKIMIPYAKVNDTRISNRLSGVCYTKSINV